MADLKKPDKDAELRKAYRSDRKDRPSHLLDPDEQRQIERLRSRVVEAVMSGEGERALDILKEMGYSSDSPEYQAVIALLYPGAKKR